MNSEIKLIKTQEGHFYQTLIGLLPSVTTIISNVVRNPALEAWKLRTPNWQETSRDAANIGTWAHRAVDSYLKEDTTNFIDAFKKGGERIEKPFMAFVEWKSNTGFRYLDSELEVWNEKRFAGSVDLIGTINDRLYLIDLKTSKRIYPDYLMQVSAYKYAFEERCGKKIEGLAILRLDKTTGCSEWKEYSETEYQHGLRMFLLLCDFWHLRKNGSGSNNLL